MFKMVMYIVGHACPAENFDAATLEADLTSDSEFSRFKEAARHSNLVPLYERVFADQLTPVTAYRCLVAEDDREAPSFLFESVVNGTQTVSTPLSHQTYGVPNISCSIMAVVYVQRWVWPLLRVRLSARLRGA